MANVSFTRDEVILALDVLYANGNQPMKPDSPAIVELSRLLNELPIVPKDDRPKTFRNCSGVCNQINSFRRESAKGIKDPNVGKAFYVVADDFVDNPERLAVIADAIRRNIPFINNASFLRDLGSQGFVEGAILEYIHCMIERRDGTTIELTGSCEICGINLNGLYKHTKGNLIQLHLAVPLEKMNTKKRYNTMDFISVCPNCHEMLHQYRPWLTRENCTEILK